MTSIWELFVNYDNYFKRLFLHVLPMVQHPQKICKENPVMEI